MSTAIKPTEIVQKFSLPSRVPTRAKMFFKNFAKMSVGHLRLQTPEQMVLNLVMCHNQQPELFIHDWRACAKIMSAADIGFAESLCTRLARHTRFNRRIACSKSK